MSGFEASWLDLREPADHAARDRAMLLAAAGVLGEAESPLVADLGCGTGSTARALRPHLRAPVRWRLVDNDPKLLGQAQARLEGEAVELTEIDLLDIDTLPIHGATLVTASALFDLVSRDWLAGLAERIAREGAGIYAALNYDGRILFADPDPADTAVVEAFNAHQGGDKGFGPALGPRSPTALQEIFGAAGFALESADSPWRLEPGPLRDEFLQGVASAVEETGRVSAGDLAAWRRRHLASAGAILVGHRDVLARPG